MKLASGEWKPHTMTRAALPHIERQGTMNTYLLLGAVTILGATRPIMCTLRGLWQGKPQLKSLVRRITTI